LWAGDEKLEAAAIPLTQDSGLWDFRARRDFDASWPGGTEVGPRSPAAVDLLVVFFLVNLGLAGQRVRTQPAPAFASVSSAGHGDATASRPSRPSWTAGKLAQKS
jgi:hypothetical protein